MIAHWDDIPWVRRAKGEMGAEWQRLGDAAGTVGVGVNRARIAPGKLSTPPHSHGASEEVVFVLGGTGLVWQDEAVFEVGAGDCVVFRADEAEHTLRAGDDGLDVLIYGTRHPVEYGWLPRSSAVRLGWPWIEGRTDDPWDVEAKAEPLAFAQPGERPPNVIQLGDLPGDEYGDKELAGKAGSKATGLHWVRRGPGLESAVPHCHSLEEEVFVVLDGGCTLELWPSPIAAERGAARESHELRAGHVVARPGGTKVAHCFRGGADGVTLLVYGTREPNDICYYPRSNKIYWRGVGVIGRIEHLEYWDGETRPE